MTTQENNKLIAEFLGWTEQKDPTERFFGQWFNPKTGERHVYLFFDTSWDWLMAVVEKIESLGHGVTIYRKGCHINNEIGFNTNGFNHSSKVEQTYKAVVEFIKWYNQQK